MQPIDSPQHFQAMLAAEHAVVFLSFPWSNRSVQSRQTMVQWQRQTAHQSALSNYRTYELAPDDQPFTWKWLETIVGSLPESEQSHGGVIWLRKSAVVGFVSDATRAGIKALNRITEDCFVHGQIHSHDSTALLQNDSAPLDPDLLKILCCPETHQGLAFADAPVLDKLNQRFAAGRLQTRSGHAITEKIEAGLIRADGRYLYPVRRNIPILLIDEAILVNG